jgi:hypothetical protein
MRMTIVLMRACVEQVCGDASRGEADFALSEFQLLVEE